MASIAPALKDQADSAWLSVFAAILAIVAGAQVVIIQPIIVQGLTDYAGYDPAAAGYILSAEMWGFAVTAIAMVVLVSRFNWHKMLYLAFGLIGFANLASLAVESQLIYAASRFFAGLGSGVLVSLGFACLGLSSNPDRNFGLAVMGALTYGAVVVYFAPQLFKFFDFAGLIWLLLLVAAASATVFHQLPSSGIKKDQAAASGPVASWRLRGAALIAMLTYFAAQGAIWSYLFLIGTGAGIQEDAVAKGLGLSQFWGIAGAFTAAIVASKFGRAIPLVLGILMGIVPVLLLLSPRSYFMYALLVGVYTYGWNMTHPYLLGVMASLDGTGATVVYAVAMQKIGLAIGPAAAAAVLSGQGYASVLWLGAAFFVVALICIFGPSVAKPRISL